YLIAQRERWADLQNKYLERYQHADRVDARSLKAQGIEREPERHFGAGQVRQFNTAQLHALMERREAERQAQHCRDECNCVIDVTTTLREALAERDNVTETPKCEVMQNATQGRTFDFEKESDKLNALVNDALSEIQDEIDLQSLINDSMAEFQNIHQELVKQQEREYWAEQRRQQENERQRLAEQKRQKPDDGWSFSR
ncbi:MobA/MobL family protein, partial [Acinetobacter sp. YH16038]